MALQLGPGHPVRGVEGAGSQRAGHLRVVLGEGVCEAGGE